MSVLDALAVRLADLQVRVSRAASFRWGVVSSANPLAVTLDADSTPTVGVSTITQVAVGSRVLVLFWGSRATILGVGGGGNPNMMFVDGTAYERTGVTTDIPQTPAFTTFTTGVHVRSVTLPLPYTPPPGYTFRYYGLDTGGYTFVSNGNSSNPGQVRILQLGNTGTDVLTEIGWELTKW